MKRTQRRDQYIFLTAQEGERDSKYLRSFEFNYGFLSVRDKTTQACVKYLNQCPQTGGQRQEVVPVTGRGAIYPQNLPVLIC
jgi:hypothetical protein